MFEEPTLPDRTEVESMVEQLMKIEGLSSIIPAEHLEFFKSIIYKKILEHIPKILNQKKWGVELDIKNLFHVHIFIPNEYGDIKEIKTIRERVDDITYLYHSKELMPDATNRNIFIDSHGRFEAHDDDPEDGALGTEGREIVIIHFSNSFEKMQQLIESSKSYLDKNSIAKVGELFFATSNMNYR